MSSIPQALVVAIEQTVSQTIASVQPVAGGDINQVVLVSLADNSRLILKYNQQAPLQMFAAEAAGLRAIQETGTIRVPEVLATLDQGLLLEYIPAGPRSADYWPVLGTALAGLHGHTGPAFGFDMENYCGLSPQPNPWMTDGHAFFAEQRLLYQGKLARSRGLLDQEAMICLERMAGRLQQLIPQQPPVLIHGDLWSGNLLCDCAGKPVLIDPAAHYGWAEAELAMTSLFGGFSEAFYRAYEASATLEPHWRERFPVYNLYHLLNHLNLFGSGYRAQVLSILDRYG